MYFGLSNGHSWLFAVFSKGEDGNRSVHVSDPIYLRKMEIENAMEGAIFSLRTIVELTMQWVRIISILQDQSSSNIYLQISPSNVTDTLYTLED